MTPECWGQLEEVYPAVRALPPSERTALLERADSELRATVAAIPAQEGVWWRAKLWPPASGRARYLSASSFATAGAEV